MGLLMINPQRVILIVIPNQKRKTTTSPKSYHSNKSLYEHPKPLKKKTKNTKISKQENQKKKITKENKNAKKGK